MNICGVLILQVQLQLIILLRIILINIFPKENMVDNDVYTLWAPEEIIAASSNEDWISMFWDTGSDIDRIVFD